MIYYPSPSPDESLIKSARGLIEKAVITPRSPDKARRIVAVDA